METTEAAEFLFDELSQLLKACGATGGLVSPSVYDTAQVLRLAPPPDPEPALRWLLDQQQPDGGWGSSLMSSARDLSTLAAILALKKYPQLKGVEEAVAGGLHYLNAHATVWAFEPVDHWMVGVELILPHLLQEARNWGWELPYHLYEPLMQVGERRRQRLAKMKPRAGTPFVHSWEAWGEIADPALLDGTGGVGHSPAATAGWLGAAGETPELEASRQAARSYLAQAAESTGLGISGVVPTVWPIVHYERAFMLYFLVVTGLWDHPRLKAAVEPQLDLLAAALREDGLGFSDYFIPDGDDSTVAVAVLKATGRAVSIEAIRQFMQEGFFSTYANELNPSLSASAHGVHALGILGEPEYNFYLDYLLQRQLPEGYWKGDKWNISWLYVTEQVVLALAENLPEADAERVLQAVLAAQKADGSWGTIEETAYAFTVMRTLRNISGPFYFDVINALMRSGHWLVRKFKFRQFAPVNLWVGKELYCPYRVVRTMELSALLAGMLEYADVGIEVPIFSSVMIH